MSDTNIYISVNGCDTGSLPTPPALEPTAFGADWVYVINGGGEPRIARASDPSITVRREQPGEYVVTFAPQRQNLVCSATINNSIGVVTAIPGDSSGLAANQVRVLTLEVENRLSGAYDFSLVVFYSTAA